MLLWLEGHMANKILIPLQILISYFLKTPMNRQWVQVRDSGRSYSSVCPKGSTICCALVAVAQLGGDSSALNLLCAKDQANEIPEYRSGI